MHFRNDNGTQKTDTYSWQSAMEKKFISYLYFRWTTDDYNINWTQSEPKLDRKWIKTYDFSQFSLDVSPWTLYCTFVMGQVQHFRNVRLIIGNRWYIRLDVILFLLASNDIGNIFYIRIECINLYQRPTTTQWYTSLILLLYHCFHFIRV